MKSTNYKSETEKIQELKITLEAKEQQIKDLQTKLHHERNQNFKKKYFTVVKNILRMTETIVILMQEIAWVLLVENFYMKKGVIKV